MSFSYKLIKLMSPYVCGHAWMVQHPVRENLSQYITSHPGQLNLAIPPCVGAMSTSDGYGHRWGRKRRVLRNS